MNQATGPELNEALRQAIQFGTLQETRHLLDLGADPDALDTRPAPSWNPRHSASPMIHLAAIRAHDGSCDHLHELASRVVDVHRENAQGETALHAAVTSGNTEAVRFLLERGLNVKHRAQDGRTPLHQVPFAIQDQGLPSLVELLIDAGADVHEQDAKGKTPLDLCIDQHNSARALLFIAHGAVDRGRVIWMHSAGISPIRAAAITGCTERVIALYDPEDPDNGLDELERLARDHRKTECLAAIQSMRAQMAIDTVTQIVDESPRHPGFSKT